MIYFNLSKILFLNSTYQNYRFQWLKNISLSDCKNMRYVNGLINLITSLVVSTIIIYAINFVAGFAGADYTFTNGEVFVIWILMAILVNNCFKK